MADVTAAKLRWRMLAKIIKKEAHREQDEKKVSVRRFSGFSLLESRKVELGKELEDGGEHTWLEYRSPHVEESEVLIRQRTRAVLLKDLTGFDNTGNVCLWPSEEVLAHYLLKNQEKFNNKVIIELGAGMTALAGVMLAAASNACEVMLTDANEDCLTNIQLIIDQNRSAFGATHIQTRYLLWDENMTDTTCLEQKFDFILSADCLFFVEYHKGLLHVIDVLMKPEGCAIFMAPRRGCTLEQFCELAKPRFHVDLCDNYDDIIWAKHQQSRTQDSTYDENIHFPILLHLRRKSHVNVPDVTAHE